MTELGVQRVHHALGAVREGSAASASNGQGAIKRRDVASFA